MSATTLKAVFDDNLTPVEHLPLEEEVTLIEQARSGDESAFERLVWQYAAGLRALVKKEYNRASGLVDAEETRANVLLAFTEAVHAARPGERVAPQLKGAVLDVAKEHHLVSGFTIGLRTRQRYMQALREAGPGGDAEAKAVELGMTRETFAAVRDALGTYSLDGVLEAIRSTVVVSGGDAYGMEPGMSAVTTERGYATVDQRLTVAKAFAAVDAITGDVIRDAYGFTEYDPIPDAEIAHRRGYSRSKVQRIRTEGLVTMRKAVDPNNEETSA